MKHFRVAASLLLLWLGAVTIAPGAESDEQKVTPAKVTPPEVTGPEADAGTESAILKLNSRGQFVADIQRTLAYHLKKELKDDGFFGAKTQQALKDFQKSVGLEPTGTVNADTLKKLEPLQPRSHILRWVMNRLSWKIENKPTVTKHLAALLACIPILILGAIAFHFATGWVSWLARRLAEASTSTWDDALVECRFFRRAALFAPALVVYFCAGLFDEPGARGLPEGFSYPAVFEFWHVLLRRLSLAFMALAGTLVAEAFGRAAESVYSRRQREDAASVRGIIQALRLFVYSVGAILFFAALSGSNPFKLIAGLGAFMAIILLVFKDTILGLVASVQIITNDLLRVGDWIEVPKYGADGDVVDISLATIKVQNFDKTVSTIPTHALMSESFRNWRPMNLSGGRRIKRAINIDMHTIKVASEELIQRWEQIEILRDYLDHKRSELDDYNDLRETDASELNGRRLTNVGTFRAYIERFIKGHEQVNQDMTCLVRQLAPTKMGLPIEVYFFCSQTAWAAYESVQADIFDHLLAILPEFELRVFQDLSNQISSEHVARPEDAKLTNGPSPSKLTRLEKKVAEQNAYLDNHPKASVATALRKIETAANQMGLADQVTVSCAGREISVSDIEAT